jgi:outer membrane receptor protein involved in Fe transport
MERHLEPGRIRSSVAWAVLGMLGVCGPLKAAQIPAQVPADSVIPDSVRSIQLQPLIVTTQRTEAPLASASAAVSRITGDALRAFGARSASDALVQVPGVALIDPDGSGAEPRLALRGFYGGGETEYAAVLLDGVPINQLGDGTVDWELFPPGIVESIEVVRGGASSLYGDAAVGGVINIRTGFPPNGLRWRLLGGENGTAAGSAAVAGSLLGRPAVGFASATETDGARHHDSRHSVNIGGSLDLLGNAAGALRLWAAAHWRRADDPGPLVEPAGMSAPASSDVFYRFDRLHQNTQRLALEGWHRLGGLKLRGYLAGELASTDAIETLPLSVDFADTQQRNGTTRRLFGSVQAEVRGLPASWSGALVFGVDGSLGRLHSTYFGVATGDRGAYTLATGAPADEPNAAGAAQRRMLAGFVHWELRPASMLRVSLGGRLDWLRDHSEPTLPEGSEPATESHVAFSPRIGVDLEYTDSPAQTGNAYVAVSRFFKAPTLDQLFDLRATPVPFPPFAVTIANPLLRPQVGWSVEAGLRHRLVLRPGRISADLSVAAFTLAMRNELDFDIASFRYVNVGRSRHRGIESHLGLTAGPAIAFVNFTRQQVLSTRGDFAGKSLKAIPSAIFSAGISARHHSGLGARVVVTALSGMYLDDANTRTIPNYARVDGGVSLATRGLVFAVDAVILLDRHYLTTGFPVPAGSDQALFYPAPGRQLLVSVGSGW